MPLPVPRVSKQGLGGFRQHCRKCRTLARSASARLPMRATAGFRASKVRSRETAQDALSSAVEIGMCQLGPRILAAGTVVSDRIK
jgi:hypothetical protein